MKTIKFNTRNWSEEQQARQEQEVQNFQQPIQQPAQEPVYEEPSPKAQQWAEDNEWFGVDEVMTDQVMAIHKRLASNPSIDLESDEYYSELNQRMREAFPHKFNNAGDNANVQTVVSGTRTTGSGRNQNDRRVKLSPSEQQLAKKLGVSV